MSAIARILRRLLPTAGLLALAGSAAWAAPPSGNPVLIGINAEFGHPTSTSAQAIRAGIRIAIDEINAAGGVLGGRPLALEERDDRSVPARAVENVRELAAMPDLVAVFCGKFSPVALELLPVVHERKLLLLNPWAAVDDIVDNRYKPNYAFRLSLRDSWAMEVLLSRATAEGTRSVGLLVPNIAWGRSNVKAAEALVAKKGGPRIASVQWYNLGDKSLIEQYQALRRAGAQVLILVANEPEGAALVRDMAGLPASERMPVLSHWGITGGRFPQLAGPALAQVDLRVVQTYSFVGAEGATARRVAQAARRMFGVAEDAEIPSPVGVAHGYDLTHILARAIDQAGSTDRDAVRTAMLKVRDYDGLVKHYAPPFAPGRQEALGAGDLLLARFDAAGRLVPDQRPGSPR